MTLGRPQQRCWQHCLNLTHVNKLWGIFPHLSVHRVKFSTLGFTRARSACFFSHPVPRLCPRISLFISRIATAVLTGWVTRHKAGSGRSEGDGAASKLSSRKCARTVTFASGILWLGAPWSYVMCEFQSGESSGHGSSLLLLLCKNVTEWGEKCLIPPDFSKRSLVFFPPQSWERDFFRWETRRLWHNNSMFHNPTRSSWDSPPPPRFLTIQSQCWDYLYN